MGECLPPKPSSEGWNRFVSLVAGNHLIICILQFIITDPEETVTTLKSSARFYAAALEIGLDNIMRNWNLLYNGPSFTPTRAGLEAIRLASPTNCPEGRPTIAENSGQAFYCALSAEEIQMGTDRLAAFEVQVLKPGTPSTSIGVAECWLCTLAW